MRYLIFSITFPEVQTIFTRHSLVPGSPSTPYQATPGIMVPGRVPANNFAKPEGCDHFAETDNMVAIRLPNSSPKVKLHQHGKYPKIL